MPADRGVVALEGQLLTFLRTELAKADADRIDADTYLFDGVIDSLKILQLIAFLEMRTGREIPDSEVVMEHFRTVRAMAARFGPP